jgi:hypothetical protein
MPIPEAAIRDPNSVEMLRAWVAEHGLHCSLKIGMYEEDGIDEARAWGILLSDVMRHISRAFSVEFNRDEAKTLEDIKGYLLAELEKPTSAASGKFV